MTGTLTNYNGTIEFAAGCILDSVVPVEPELPDVPVDPEPEEPELPEINGKISIADALAMGNAMEHNTTTVDKYYVTGTITDILNTTYGNMHIADDQGNTIYIYGLYDSTGSLRFNALDTQPAVGDTITVYTVVGNYNGPQLKNAWLIETH